MSPLYLHDNKMEKMDFLKIGNYTIEHVINSLNRQEWSTLAAFTPQIHKVFHNSFTGIQLYLLTWNLRQIIRSSDYLTWYYNTGSKIHPSPPHPWCDICNPWQMSEDLGSIATKPCHARQVERVLIDGLLESHTFLTGQSSFHPNQCFKILTLSVHLLFSKIKLSLLPLLWWRKSLFLLRNHQQAVWHRESTQM